MENGIVYLSGKYTNVTGTLFYLLFPLLFLQTIIIYVLLKYYHLSQEVFNIAIVTAFIVANIALYYITAFFHAKKEFFTINLINTIANLLQAICLSYLFFAKRNSLLNSLDIIFFILTLAAVLQVLFLMIYFRLRYKLFFKKMQLSAVILKGIFAYSGLNFISSILLFLISRIDFYYVEKYCDLHTLGNYAQAAKIGQMSLILPGLLGGVVFPYSINASDNFIEKVAFLCRMVTMFFLILLFCILISGYYFFPFLLGKEFDTVFPIILLTLPGIYFMSINLIVLSYLEGKNKQKIILYANLTALFIIIIGDAYFVPLYKYTAAAIIFSLANLAGTAALLNYFIKNTPLGMASLFKISLKDIKRIQLIRR